MGSRGQSPPGAPGSHMVEPGAFLPGAGGGCLCGGGPCASFWPWDPLSSRAISEGTTASILPGLRPFPRCQVLNQAGSVRTPGRRCSASQQSLAQELPAKLDSSVLVQGHLQRTRASLPSLALAAFCFHSYDFYFFHYTILSISTVQQSDAVIHIYFFFSHTIPRHVPSRRTRESSLPYCPSGQCNPLPPQPLCSHPLPLGSSPSEAVSWPLPAWHRFDNCPHVKCALL